MSKRNRTINQLIQGTGLYDSLPTPKRKTLRAMLERAYAAGASHATPSYEVPEPLAGVIQVHEGYVFRNETGETLVDATFADSNGEGEMILVRTDGSTATLRGEWETGWTA